MDANASSTPRDGRGRVDSWLSWEDLPGESAFKPKAPASVDMSDKAASELVGHVSSLRLAAVRMLASGLFGLFITALIVTNTILLALDHYPASECVFEECV